MQSEPTFSDVEDEERLWGAEDIYRLHDEGLNNVEISHKLDISLSAVGRHLRAREKNTIQSQTQRFKNRLKRNG